jgi:hypothetical protein
VSDENLFDPTTMPLGADAELDQALAVMSAADLRRVCKAQGATIRELDRKYRDAIDENAADRLAAHTELTAVAAERDRLRTAAERSREQLQAEVLAHAETARERDRLRDATQGVIELIDSCPAHAFAWMQEHEAVTVARRALDIKRGADVSDDELEDENARLRAVVEAARAYRDAVDIAERPPDLTREEYARRGDRLLAALGHALDQLDVSGNIGGPGGRRHLAQVDQQSHGVCMQPYCGRPLDDPIHIESSAGGASQAGRGTPADRGAGAANTGAPPMADLTADELHERRSDEPDPLERRLAELDDETSAEGAP